MSRAIVLGYFYKANEGLCKTYVMKSLLDFLNLRVEHRVKLHWFFDTAS